MHTCKTNFHIPQMVRVIMNTVLCYKTLADCQCYSPLLPNHCSNELFKITHLEVGSSNSIFQMCAVLLFFVFLVSLKIEIQIKIKIKIQNALNIFVKSYSSFSCQRTFICSLENQRGTFFYTMQINATDSYFMLLFSSLKKLTLDPFLSTHN